MLQWFGGFLCSFCVPISNSGGAGGCFGPLGLGGGGRSPGVVWGCWLLDQGMGGVAEKGTVLLRIGVEYCPTSSPPLHGLWGSGKQAGGLSAIRVRNNLNPMLGFQRFQVFIELVLIENCGILKIAKSIRTMRGCIQCLARRKRAAGRAADSVRYGRRCCSRAIPGVCRQF